MLFGLLPAHIAASFRFCHFVLHEPAIAGSHYVLHSFNQMKLRTLPTHFPVQRQLHSHAPFSLRFTSLPFRFVHFSPRFAFRTARMAHASRHLLFSQRTPTLFYRKSLFIIWPLSRQRYARPHFACKVGAIFACEVSSSKFACGFLLKNLHTLTLLPAIAAIY